MGSHSLSLEKGEMERSQQNTLMPLWVLLPILLRVVPGRFL